ncbi:addiction module toxin, HicA family [Thermosulfurimonas marina]|uniref:Addiction module toxin, HicA family n=1 Tax=Thermosulfurimonas marina TaxID=2047767 RepID=A0A6H1WQH0_9BACT|nr:type II toxin-antitoxin system HicA family toxin [Thermosulfurimonas marina]QJA05386.1 addiction module toxin, HicA family [Thermosulfurimonas marina]
MPKLPRLTAVEAEKLLLQAGFELIRFKGSHKIYKKKEKRFVLPFHSGKNLHPKIVKQLLEIVSEEGSSS